MKTLVLLIAMLVISVDVHAGSALERIRAAESLSYFVEARFPRPSLRSADLEGSIFHSSLFPESYATVKNGDSTPSSSLFLLQAAFSAAVEIAASGEGKLWLPYELSRGVRGWDGRGGIIKPAKIRAYGTVEELSAGFDVEKDIAVIGAGHLEAIALKDGHGLDNAVLLSFAGIRPECMDGVFTSLVLVRELRQALAETGRDAVAARGEFALLKILLEVLMAENAGFTTDDVIEMIPQDGVPFARRALAILRHSFQPIQRHDLERIRAVQESLRGV